MRIAVIVPTLNEEPSLTATLACVETASETETIVVDGGSTDATVRLAQEAGAIVVHAPRGRGAQMNVGATVTRSPALVFLHADTSLPTGWADAVRATLEDPAVAVGAFRFATDVPGVKMRALEWLVWLRCRLLSRPHGDQALFMRAETFAKLAGFPEMPLLEDYDLVTRAKRLGRVVTLDMPALTSGRMWLRLGVVRMTWRNLATVAGYRLGIHPARLARWRSR